MKAPDLLQRIASKEALWTAWDEVRSARGAPGVDGVSVREFERGAQAHLHRLVLHDGASAPLAPDLRAVVIADGALCRAAALRRLLERGTALRFIESVVPAPGETAASPPG